MKKKQRFSSQWQLILSGKSLRQGQGQGKVQEKK